MDIHRRLTEATIGIISTSNQLPLPNIMLIARPAPMQNTQLSSGSRAEQLVLTRWVHEGPALRRLALGGGVGDNLCSLSWSLLGYVYAAPKGVSTQGRNFTSANFD